MSYDFVCDSGYHRAVAGADRIGHLTTSHDLIGPGLQRRSIEKMLFVVFNLCEQDGGHDDSQARNTVEVLMTSLNQCSGWICADLEDFLGRRFFS